VDELMTSLILRLPLSTVAEMALCGAMLFGSRGAVTAARTTRPEDWSEPDLEAIARTCLDVSEAGGTVEPISVCAALEESEARPLTGGWTLRIVDCMSACTVPSAAPAWAAIIRRTAAKRRRVLKAVTTIQKDLEVDRT